MSLVCDCLPVCGTGKQVGFAPSVCNLSSAARELAAQEHVRYKVVASRVSASSRRRVVGVSHPRGASPAKTNPLRASLGTRDTSSREITQLRERTAAAR